MVAYSLSSWSEFSVRRGRMDTDAVVGKSLRLSV